MKIGDLVRFEHQNPEDARKFGTVLQFDYWSPEELEVFPIQKPEKIVEILWNNGSLGWILQGRVSVINEKEEKVRSA